MKGKIVFALLILILGGVAGGVYLFNKPRQSIMDDKPAAVLAAASLVTEFEADEAKSNKLYLGKIIEVTGIIDATNTDEKGILYVTLRGVDLAGVGCQFEKNKLSASIKLNPGETVTIKGICTGILVDVVLVDCVIVK